MSDLTPANSTDLLPEHPIEWRSLTGLAHGEPVLHVGPSDEVVVHRTSAPATYRLRRLRHVAELSADDQKRLARRLAADFEPDTVSRLAETYSIDVAELALMFRKMIRKFGYPPVVCPTAAQIIEFLGDV